MPFGNDRIARRDGGGKVAARNGMEGQREVVGTDGQNRSTQRPEITSNSRIGIDQW